MSMSSASCAVLSAELKEPLPGTAAVAKAWVLVEEPGPWAAKAVRGSAWARWDGAAPGVRAGLIRRHGRADRTEGRERTAFVAWTAPRGGWVRRMDAGELGSVDAEALAAGVQPEAGEPWTGEPLALVCTNGRRDVCCATLGRPLAAALAAAGHGAVWETTHLGGHRFAPTMLVLPYGYTYGRLTPEDATRVLEATARGRMLPAPELCRGRSTWERAGQAAELALRERIGEDAADALTVRELPEGACLVEHEDGRAWEVATAVATSTPARPESCGKAPDTPARVDVLRVTPA